MSNWNAGIADKVQRRGSIRLKDYDYSQSGAYFITICTQDRACLFGEIADANTRCNAAGQMATSEWLALPERFPTVRLDEFVIMPNHIHGILWVNRGTVGAGLVPAHDPASARDRATIWNRATTRVAPTANVQQNSAPVGAGLVPAHAPTIGDIVGAFKSLTTVAYIRGIKTSGWPTFRGQLWQRNYYEHIIRDDEDLNQIRQYIIDNPAQWAMDRENPMNAETANNAGVGAGLVPARDLVPAYGNRATTRVAPTIDAQQNAATVGANNAGVGAGLVPAHDLVPAYGNWATTRVAPTIGAQQNAATVGANNANVGAGLVPALMKGQNHDA
jgi:REP element-mobilizing transposase RayT